MVLGHANDIIILNKKYTTIENLAILLDVIENYQKNSRKLMKGNTHTGKKWPWFSGLFSSLHVSINFTF